MVRLDGFKDPSALYLDNPKRFVERWQTALDAAEPFTALAERQSAAQADELTANLIGVVNATAETRKPSGKII